MHLDPDHLITFSVVAEYGNISRAAEALELSQPAVSGQLRALQELAGQRLYRRSSRGIVLTEAGTRLLGYANVVASATRGAAETIRHAQQPTLRPLRLGLSWTLGSFAPSVITHAHAEGYTVLAESAHSEHLISQVQGGRLEAALVVSGRQALPEGLSAQRFHSEDLALVVPRGHPLAGMGFTPLTAIAADTFLWSSAESSLSQHADRLLKESAVLPARQLRLGSVAAVREALMRGLGVSILPRSLVQRDLQAGLIASLQIEAPNITLEYSVVSASPLFLTRESKTLLRLITESRRAAS
ncbi:DNA-binding transcriptional LysR family regulator [Deinobacterium chartae]|uniref:DNA-binding transcriptional LysR family regulator n=1 Tax=Deinobacterium chartae TaxID=521158 RepID=A0A841I4W9_9DEIO|nr:LysR family transcriptional regulator [Deinobacterium chartae]MBB6099468.1 DNA-binding transcriptional LysR family regulator [Deinobacterium chartae]